MSLASFFGEKCVELLKENISLTLQKLSDPASFIQFSAEGALVDAAKGGMGSLSKFAGDYIQKNASGLAVEALQAAGLEDTVQQAFTLANNVMAAGIMANNELVMFFIRNLANGIIDDIDAKQERLEDLTEALVDLHNLLRVLTKGNPAYSEYVARQRRALQLVVQGRNNLRIVRNTFEARNLWLSRQFTLAKSQIRDAQELIMPSQNAPGVEKAVAGGDALKSALGRIKGLTNIPGSDADITDARADLGTGIKEVLQTLLEDTPFPTTEEQMQAIAAIPKASAAVLSAASGYFEVNVRLNAKLSAFKLALGSIQNSLPGYFKKYILGLFDPLLRKTDRLAESMAQTLNGSSTAFAGPLRGYKPKTSNVTVMSFQWAMDINLIFQSFKTIPEGALNSLTISQQSSAAYESAVKRLKAMGTVRAYDVIIPYTEGEEQLADFESQLVLFLLEANGAIVSNSIRKEVLQVATAMLRRLSLTTTRLGQIRSIMQAFASTPFELEDITRKAGEGLLKVFSDAGLDNALGALNSGDFNKFFKLNPRESTTVGAALVTIAALKRCFPSDTVREKLSQTQFELEKDADLLNIKFSLDFDIAILKNLQECARATALAANFNLDELLCGVVEESGVGAGLSKLSDVLSF